MSCPECGRKDSYSFDAGDFVKWVLKFILGLGALGLMTLGAVTLHQGYVEDFAYRIKHPDEERQRTLSELKEFMQMHEDVSQ